MKLIGLTGGIASGKSTVGRMLAKAGVAVVDADQLARDAVAPGTSALSAIVERFGRDLLTDGGTLDRAKLGSIVFTNNEARAALNAIVHPAVGQLAAETLDAIRQRGDAVAVYEVPLLFENGLEQMMDATILVACDDDLQLRRVMQRDHLDEAAARARVSAQMSLAEKRTRTPFVVENDGSLADLAARTAEVFAAASGLRLALAP